MRDRSRDFDAVNLWYSFKILGVVGRVIGAVLGVILAVCRKRSFSAGGVRR